MVTQSDVQGWAGGLDAVLGRIASRFGGKAGWNTRHSCSTPENPASVTGSLDA